MINRIGDIRYERAFSYFTLLRAPVDFITLFVVKTVSSVQFRNMSSHKSKGELLNLLLVDIEIGRQLVNYVKHELRRDILYINNIQ